MSDHPRVGEVLRQIPPLNPEGAAEVALSHDDTKATQEALGFSHGDLEQRSKEKEHTRTESFRDHVHRIFICGVWFVGLLWVGATLVLAWHYVTPESWGWLTAEQTKILTAVITSSAVTGTASRYMARRLP